MSFEDNSTQSTLAEVSVPIKKRGRPAGAKNKKPVAKKTKTVGRPVSNPSRLKAELEFANTRVVLLQDAISQLRESYDVEIDGLRAIISYLESALKEAWAK